MGGRSAYHALRVEIPFGAPSMGRRSSCSEAKAWVATPQALRWERHVTRRATASLGEDAAKAIPTSTQAMVTATRHSMIERAERDGRGRMSMRNA